MENNNNNIQDEEFFKLLKEFEKSEEYQKGLDKYLSSNNCEDYYESDECSEAFEKFLEKKKNKKGGK